MTPDVPLLFDPPSNDNFSGAPTCSPADVIARAGLDVLQECSDLAKGALPRFGDALGPRATMVRAAADLVLRIAAWDCGEGGRVEA